jgi:hypothetical protein
MCHLARRLTASILVLSFGWTSLGCSTRTVRKIDPAQTPAPAEQIVGLTTTHAEDVSFDPPGAALVNGNVVGQRLGVTYTIPLADVQRLWVERRRTSVIRTVGLVTGIVAGTIVVVVAVALAMKESCPFVYSWDGEQFVFDAEPYGGAITRGLERDDFAELEHLRADAQGQYRLLLTNEVDETQFTNSVELWAVDAPPSARVVVDESGTLHGLTAPLAPSAATGRNGMDLLPWLRASDRVVWEPEPVAAADGSVRDEILLTFPRPAGATRAQLVVNAATGLWGSHMIKRLVELRGREAPAWFDRLDRDPAAVQALHERLARDEIYRLNVEVAEADGWRVRGTIPPGGPFISEERVVALDVSQASGPNLRIRLRPPLGFWAVNAVAIDYAAEAPVAVTRVLPVSARTDDGTSVLGELLAKDEQYYAMPATTDRAEIRFPAPPERPGLKRTVFLHSRGWYALHLNTSTEPETALLESVRTTPEGTARFAASEYARWKAGRR